MAFIQTIFSIKTISVMTLNNQCIHERYNVVDTTITPGFVPLLKVVNKNNIGSQVFINVWAQIYYDNRVTTNKVH